MVTTRAVDLQMNLERIDILTIFTLSIHEHGLSLDVFSFSLISLSIRNSFSTQVLHIVGYTYL